MTERPYLLALLLVEAGIVAALFLLLLVWPLLRRWSEARRRRQRTELLEALRSRDADEGSGSVRTALARCRPGVLLRSLETLEEEGIGPADLDLDALVRATPAFRRIERAARSVLWWRRQTAAQLLARIGRPNEDRRLLVALMRDAHPAVSTAALMAARRLGWPGLVEPLLDLAQEGGPGHRGEEELHHETVAALADDAVPELRSRLEAARGPEELTLLRIAARVGDERLVDHLVERLRHGGLEVRIQAAKSLAAVGSPEAVDPLRAALEDPAWEVRTQAARALGDLGVEAAAPDLRRALSDPSWWVRLRAALALRRLGTQGREMLEGVQPDADRFAADMARYVLGLDESALREYGR